MTKIEKNQALQAQLQAAAAANHDLQVLAAGLGVPVAKLIRCLLSKVKIAQLIACLRSDDFFGCLGDSVDWAGVVECALGLLPGAEGEPEF